MKRGYLMYAVFTVAIAIAAQSLSLAQQKSAPIAPATSLKDGWEEIDQRLVFLMVRLANTETSLDAVEKALGITTRQVSSSVADAKRAEQGNEKMDRQGGGPMRWSEFYGRTAEKFFYHPVDRSTSYHTGTILSQQQTVPQQKPGNVPGYQGVPLSQRPPQFDYIYRANEEAKARAEKEAADMRSKRDQLLARRRSLEEEQSGLWCEIAFRAVSHYDLDRKPIYRFEPLLAADADAAAKQHAETLKTAVVFMRKALSVVSEAQKDQATSFRNVKQVIADGREKLDDAWLRQAIDPSNRNTPEARFAALAKRLDDVSNNLSDSYKVSIDGERFKDELRKNTFRGLLQESLVNYAEVLLALDEMSIAMANQWRIKPDIDQPLGTSIKTGAIRNAYSPVETKTIDLLSQIRLPADIVSGNWTKAENGILMLKRSGQISNIIVRYSPSGEYRLDMKVERIDGERGLFVQLPILGNQVAAEIDAGAGYSGLTFVDNKPVQENETKRTTHVFKKGVPVDLSCLVTKKSITVSADGTNIVEWQGSPNRLSTRTADLFFHIGSWGGGSFTVHSIEITPLPSEISTPDSQQSKKSFATGGEAAISLDDLASWHLSTDSKLSLDRVFSPISDGAFKSRAVGNSYDSESIFTKEEFGDFDLSLEYCFIPQVKVIRYDAGLLIHASGSGKPIENDVELQICDGETGDLYVGQRVQLATPPDRAKNSIRRLRTTDAFERPLGQWNELRVQCDADAVTVWLNGKVVNAGSNFSRSRGPIGLMAQGVEVAYRNIKIKRIKDLVETQSGQSINSTSQRADSSTSRSSRQDSIVGDGSGWLELGEQDFVNVNCDPETFSWKDGIAYCTGKPIGVIRTQKTYTNFEMVAQWMHLSSGGNSGIFVWADPESVGKVARGKFPKAIELQILDHGFKEQYERSTGKKADWFTTNGDLIPVNGAKFKPFEPASPDGTRSFPRKHLSKGFNEWNDYYILCNNGEVRLSVNGEEVSGCNSAIPSSGYVCLESEGAPIKFKNLRIHELP